MSTVKRFSGKVSSVSYSAKAKSFIIGSGSQSIIVGESLINNIAMANGYTRGSLLRSLKGSTIECDIVNVLKGEHALDRNGKVQLNQLGQPIIYSKDHARYQNVTFEISAMRQKQIEEAEAIGQALVSSYALPSLPSMSLPSVEEGRVEEEPVIEVTDTTTEHSLSDIAASMTTETPAQ